VTAAGELGLTGTGEFGVAGAGGFGIATRAFLPPHAVSRTNMPTMPLNKANRRMPSLIPRGQGCGQHLDGNVSLKSWITRGIDFTHAALAE
jgi:hypothetical protein